MVADTLLTLSSDGLDESPTTHVEQSFSNSLQLSLEEWPRLPFTVCIERAPS
jgi:hypothetical protein